MNPSCHPKEYDNHAVHEPRGYFLFYHNVNCIANSIAFAKNSENHLMWRCISAVFLCHCSLDTIILNTGICWSIGANFLT